MLSTDRDYKRGGEHLAIPTQSEIEGKLLVFEVVAVACLQELLKHEHARVISKVRQNIRRTLKEKCSSLKLCSEDEKATADYALGVLDAAVAQVSSK
ncbi:hypothetical protein [Rhizobium sp. LjRoot258]|jgi:hypothetical protein|uniref:hypothetical protein n=1 Tax=Rhizobium sp. LjRoot258 TaxID=3342299 RepID=UPI003ECF643E